MSSLAGSGGSGVDKRTTSSSKVHPTIPKISSNSLKAKVSPARTVKLGTSKLSKFVPPRRVAEIDNDQDRKEILKELLAQKPKQKNKPKLSTKHKVNTKEGNGPIKPIISKSEQVVHREKSDHAKLVETQSVQVEPAKDMIKTFVSENITVTSVSVTTPETNHLVATKSKPVEVLSIQRESTEYEDVDISETKTDEQSNNGTKVYKCEKMSGDFFIFEKI